MSRRADKVGIEVEETSVVFLDRVCTPRSSIQLVDLTIRVRE
jgi:hypothetical protein